MLYQSLTLLNKKKLQQKIRKEIVEEREKTKQEEKNSELAEVQERHELSKKCHKTVFGTRDLLQRDMKRKMPNN